MKYRVVLEIEVPEPSELDHPMLWAWECAVRDYFKDGHSTPVLSVHAEEIEDAT